MKRMIALLLALALCLCLAACSKKPEQGAAAPETEPNQTETTKPEASKPAASAYAAGDYTKALAAELAKLMMGPFRMSMKMPMDDGTGAVKDVEAVIYIDGESKMAAEIELQGQQMRVVFVDSDGYLIMDSEKMALKTDSVDAIDSNVDDIMDMAEESAGAKFETGTEQIDGKTYVWESVAGESTKLYFEQESGAWKYARTEDDGQQSLVEITAYDDKVDVTVFEIPTDYQILDMAGIDLSGYVA